MTDLGLYLPSHCLVSDSCDEGLFVEVAHNHLHRDVYIRVVYTADYEPCFFVVCNVVFHSWLKAFVGKHLPSPHFVAAQGQRVYDVINLVDA